MELAPNVWPVRSIRAQIESVIANLATNARDAMPRGGTLAIVTRMAAGRGLCRSPY